MKTLMYLATALLSLKAFANPDFTAAAKDFRQTLDLLVKADTSNPPGNEARAVEILAARLKAAHIDYQVLDFGPGRKNLIARLKATDPDPKLKALLLIAHIDVVGTKDQNWTVPPHQVTEKEGYLYGRGVLDDLGMAVANLQTVIALHQEKAALKRDVILAFTGDEESAGLGILSVLKTHPELLAAGIALNEGGSLVLGEDGKVKVVRLQVAEKIYQDFSLVAHGPTGHSSVPQKGNAIYRLAEALVKLGKYQPDERLIPATRPFYAAGINDDPRMAKAMRALAQAKGKLPPAALKVIHESPILTSPLSTTCVATMLQGGTKVNALPAQAQAMVNCRILPDETIAQVKARLEKVIADPQVEVQLSSDDGVGGPSPVEGEVPTAVKTLVSEMYPSAPVIPSMVNGATDSRFLRQHGVEAYGISPIASHETDLMRAHGIDERIPAASIVPGLEFEYRLVRSLAGKN
jgi:acetylornithine deacetylase/succinyl-diaminopimelate desuccinylase-like protein